MTPSQFWITPVSHVFSTALSQPPQRSGAPVRGSTRTRVEQMPSSARLWCQGPAEAGGAVVWTRGRAMPAAARSSGITGLMGTPVPHDSSQDTKGQSCLPPGAACLLSQLGRGGPVLCHITKRQADLSHQSPVCAE